LLSQILSIENMLIREKVEKLGNLTESLGIMQMNSNLITSV